MKKVIIVSSSPLFMNLLEQDILSIKNVSNQISLTKFEYQHDIEQFKNEMTEEFDMAFVFNDETDAPLLIAEQIRLKFPNAFIAFAHTLPDSVIIRDFSNNDIAHFSLPLTDEKFLQLLDQANHPARHEQNAKHIDELIYKRLKRYIRLL